LSEDSNSSSAISRKQILQDGVKRLTRLLEAEQASAYAQEFRQPVAHIHTGLTALMASDEAISPRVVEPYQEFAKGVSAGYEDHGGKNWAVLDLAPADREDASSGDLELCAPRIGVHPVFSEGESTRWMTLEVNVEKGRLEDVSSLKFSLLGEFSFVEPYQSLHTNVIKLVMRGNKVDGTYEDIEIGFFPITTIPMAHTLFLKREKLQDWLNSMSNVKLIFWLPNYGRYRFNLYGCSLEVE
jgi:hypothetical protein